MPRRPSDRSTAAAAAPLLAALALAAGCAPTEATRITPSPAAAPAPRLVPTDEFAEAAAAGGGAAAITAGASDIAARAAALRARARALDGPVIAPDTLAVPDAATTN